jgi:glutathione synthase/RimK-type ligase-like ATP-grasp enzyme
MNTKVLLILLCYIILWVLWWYRLDYVDKHVVKDIIYYSKRHPNLYQKLYIVRSNASDLPKLALEYFQYIFLVLTLPIRDSDYLTEKFEGSMYVHAQVLKDSELAFKMHDKVWWYNIFNENGILTPQIYYYSKNSKIVKIANMPNNTNVIVKPANGYLGILVKKIPSNESLAYLKQNDNTIIQEMIIDYTGQVRHFRIITTSTGEIFSIFSLSTTKGIASNHGAGGKVKDCNYGDCIEENNKDVLNKMADKLKNLHSKTVLSKYYSIGWDVMISNKNGLPVAYCLEGNAPHSVWFYPDHMNKEHLIKYRQGFMSQYKK